jgi:hypothetical protein
VTYTTMQKLSSKLALHQAERDYLIVTGWTPKRVEGPNGASEEHWCRADLGRSCVAHDVAIATQKMHDNR